MIKQAGTVVKRGQILRCGYTTGTCATAAAVAAAHALLCGENADKVLVTLPSGESLEIEVDDTVRVQGGVRCGVIKDAGDDPDVTHGIKISAEVCLITEQSVRIDGGKGVGRVTGPGLQCKPGEAAINPAPRRMITQNLKEMASKADYSGGFDVVISAQGGAKIAKNTFNPRLGIEGGISILGTTGIVEPMSESAIVETIKLEIDRRKQLYGGAVLLTPGNYGRDFCMRLYGFDIDSGVKYSNYLGETLDHLVFKGCSSAMIVGHIGKLVKVAGGVMNTHSSVADCRAEIIAAHAALAGVSRETVEQIMNSITTDVALSILDDNGITQSVCRSILNKIQYHLDMRTKGLVHTEVIVFGAERVLAVSPGAEEMIKTLKAQEKSV